ncbi:hypothetical protein F5Y18DRAFT_427189 [Xylariaceae sp. FL1019]|nr:hypothetical protein F5Y18DRAFT_427189 [Xylariaceae sp. FL1019]
MAGGDDDVTQQQPGVGADANHGGEKHQQSAPTTQPESAPPRSGNDAAQAPAAASKPGIMARLGLDAPTLIVMFKGGLAPVIGLAMNQSFAVAQEFSTVGYLVGIISVLSLTILPRGKYTQTLILNLLFLGIGSAVALLILWSALQARLHTATTAARYNSSQAAVSGVWLFANIWLVNTLRAKFPSLNIPSIVYSILTNITCTLSPLITSNAAFEVLIRRLITAMLAGFAVATAVSLIILPVPSRAATMGQFKGCIMLLRGAVKQEKAYLQSLEREDMFAVPADISCATQTMNDSDRFGDGRNNPSTRSKNKNDKEKPQPVSTAEGKAIKDTMFKIRVLVGKIYVDLPFAKRDIAYAKLGAKDLGKIFELMRGITIAISGIGTVIDIFQRLAEKRGWMTTSETSLEDLYEKNEEKRIWNEVMKQLHEPFELLSAAIDGGLQHAGLVLEILPRPKTPKTTSQQANGAASPAADADVEAVGDLVQPGDAGYAEVLKKQIRAFRDIRESIVHAWAKEKGLSTEGISPFEEVDNNSFPQTDTTHHRDQSQLYILLYLETLMEAAGEAVLGFAQFADSKVADGTMARKRLIVPGTKVLRKWAASVFGDEDKHEENHADLFDSGVTIVYMGDSFAQKRDPEHLPAKTAWQRFGNVLRAISRFFASEESAFGFRCAAATLTVGIVAFLENTQIFFQEQRLVWAMIIIAIGMTQTSGQSIFGFFLRILGTLVGAIFSLIAWYIVDEKTPGILVFLYLFQVFTMYFLVKYPQMIPGVMICLVTQVLIIGYELQARKIGVAAAEQSGQPYYPIYKLAPYRLATVAAGCAIAFFWTIFPSPITERSWLRRDLSTTLYMLATYFSAIDGTLESKLKGTYGDRNVKGTPAYHLAKHRRRLYSKLMLLLPSLAKHAEFQRWEPTIGGHFPRELYQDIIVRASRINSYLSLLSYTIGGGGIGSPEMTITDSLDAATAGSSSSTVGIESKYKAEANNRAWLDALRVLLADIHPTQQSIIGVLTLLSNALQSGHSLPPHLSLPRPYELTRQLEAIDAAAKSTRARGLLDAKNMTQAGYAEFAILQVCSALVCDDIEGLVKTVSKLVGVVDFSYRVGDASTTTSAGSSITGVDSGNENGNKGKVD